MNSDLWRQRDREVLALDLQVGGPEFKSHPDRPLAGFVLDNPELNPLSPNIHKQILQTDLYTFPYRISREKLIKDQRFFSL